MKKLIKYIFYFFLVSIDASTSFIKTGETFNIDCNIFGLSGADLLSLNVEILLRQNQYIKRILKGSIYNFKNNGIPEYNNYRWMVDFYYKDDDYHNRTIVRLHVSSKLSFFISQSTNVMFR